MKKMVAIAACAALVAGSAFAEDGWNVSGGLYTGATANFDDSTVSMVNQDFGNNRIRINANYTNENVGFKSRVEFAAKSSSTWKTSIEDDTWAANLQTPQFVYGYGYADLFDGALSLKVGRMYANDFGANFSGFGMYGNGGALTWNTPVEGLSFGINGYIPSSKLSASETWDFWKDTLYYGASYGNDYFSVSAGFGREACYGNEGSILTAVSVSPIDQLSFFAETDVLSVTEDAPAFEAFGDITVSPVDALSIDLLYTVEATLGEDKSFDNGVFESEVTYGFTDAITADLIDGVNFNGDGYQGFYVMPGAKFQLGPKTSMNAYYCYESEKGAMSLTKAAVSAGNSIIIDFAFGF